MIRNNKFGVGALVFKPSSFTLDKDLLLVPPSGPSNFGYRILFSFFFFGGGGGGGGKITFFGGVVVTRPQLL